jgi:AmmeMemoRadiSam system protein B/AmmeMemoRadiSam system protein A
MPEFTETREAAVAGQFYPARTEALSESISRCLKPPKITLPGRIRALIVPHAGYQYSGPTAGQAYALLRDRTDIRRVVVVAPTHRVAFRGISIGNFSCFETPFGKIDVDTQTCAAMVAADPLFCSRPDAHYYEHALEVQLPFLQTVLPDVQLIPLVTGQLRANDLERAADVLGRLAWQDDTLWIASSDFTHYGQMFDYLPFTDNVQERLKELDMGAVRRIEEINAEAFQSYLDETGATICGATPIIILMKTLQIAEPAAKARLITYTTSGQMTRDFSHSVSYVSIAVTDTGDARPRSAEEATMAESELSRADRQTLLKLAQRAIESNLGSEPLAEVDETELSDALKRDGAAFVSLHRDGNLRGCIGNLEAVEPLYRNVIHNARNAAFQDPRFMPLTAAELAGLNIEISVLTPPRPIHSVDEFQIGTHGIILTKGQRRAVFLPQVAPEQGWDRETTLTHLSLKAGMGPDDWRRGAKYYVFEAIVFSE